MQPYNCLANDGAYFLIEQALPRRGEEIKIPAHYILNMLLRKESRKQDWELMGRAYTYSVESVESLLFSHGHFIQLYLPSSHSPTTLGLALIPDKPLNVSKAKMLVSPPPEYYYCNAKRLASGSFILDNADQTIAIVYDSESCVIMLNDSMLFLDQSDFIFTEQF